MSSILFMTCLWLTFFVLGNKIGSFMGVDVKEWMLEFWGNITWKQCISESNLYNGQFLFSGWNTVQLDGFKLKKTKTTPVTKLHDILLTVCVLFITVCSLNLLMRNTRPLNLHRCTTLSLHCLYIHSFQFIKLQTSWNHALSHLQVFICYGHKND